MEDDKMFVYTIKVTAKNLQDLGELQSYLKDTLKGQYHLIESYSCRVKEIK